MDMGYSEKELNEAYLSLSEGQRKVLDNYVKRGMKTKWLNLWAKKKGAVLEDKELEDPESAMERLLEWVLIDYEDSLTINPATRCECGRALRYRYTILHKETGKIYKLGRVHFQEHTGLDPETVRLVMKGIKEIDTEREDILSKVISGWTLPFVIPLDLEMPKDIQEQLKVNLPLLDRQVYRLSMMIRRHNQSNYRGKSSGFRPQPSAGKSYITTEIAVPDISNIDMKNLLGKLKSFQISGWEAKQLYYYMKEKPEALISEGYKIEELRAMATRALGKIGNTSIRKWLVEIECI